MEDTHRMIRGDEKKSRRAIVEDTHRMIREEEKKRKVEDL